MNTIKRNSSIELLRMLAAMMVIVLHFNFFPAGGGVVSCTSGITREILLILEALCAAAVNIFLLISGYFGCDSKSISFAKIIRLIFQTIIFSLCFTILSFIINGQWNIKTLAASVLPMNYYVILYSALMIVAPFINLVINKLSEKGIRILALLSFLVFSVYPTVVDIMEEITGSTFSGLSSVSILGSINGYTIINFMLLYILGVCMKKINFTSKGSKGFWFILLIGSLAVLYLWYKFLPDSALMYSNPLLILEAVSLLVLFSRMNIQSPFINAVAPAAFTCYLIHEPIFNFIGTRFIEGKSLPVVLLALVISIIVIYALSFGVMKLWDLITKPLYKVTIDRIPKINID